jgi:hypothetical protein
MKINYDKTKMVPMSLTKEEAYNYAAMIDYNISNFPITYLALYLHDRAIKISDWDGVVAKF